MRIGISTGILLVVVALTCGCNQSDLEYNENDYGYDIEMATPTAFTENKTMVYLNDFQIDSEYIQSGYSPVIFDNGLVFFTTGNQLFRYDVSTGEKQSISEYLSSASIFLYEEKIYFLEPENVKYYDIKSSETVQVFNRAEGYRFLHDFGVGVISEEQCFLQDFFIVDNYIQVYELASNGDGYLVAEVYAELDRGEWRLLSDYYGVSSSEEGFKYCSPDIGFLGVALYGRAREKKTGEIEFFYLSSFEYYTKQVKCEEYISSVNDVLYFSFNEEQQLRLYGYDYKADEIVFERNLAGSIAKTTVLGQYVLCYSYNESVNEDDDVLFEPMDMVLLDTEMNVVYINEEINQVVSGSDIYYTDLFFSDFYLDDNTLYMLQNRMEYQWYCDELSRETDERFVEDSKIGLVIGNYTDFYTLDLPSEVNIYKAEVIDGKLHFTLLYQEFAPEE